MAEELNLLVLEDDADDAEVLIYELNRSGFRSQWQHGHM